MKRARVSKLSGTGECPITLLFELKASTHSIGIWTGLFVHPSIIGGSRVICQGLQERRDELNLF